MNYAFLNDPSFSGTMPTNGPGALFVIICLAAIVVVALTVRLIERRRHNRQCAKTADAMALLHAVASQCPKCDSRDTTTPTDAHPYTECRRCGAKFGLCEVSIKVD